MGTKKQEFVEQYVNVPLVKDDASFDEALAIHRQCIAAGRYWKEEKDKAYMQSRVNECLHMLHKWSQVESKATAVIQSYQLRMF